ncbi:NUDIX domain-containing protein [Haladaptatus sp. CMAA 1911]|uniref:NUDIX domain-containing protein n=1 Tax=unclassified Haladaptatus TaxID=2622732 RepID=UPI00375497BE
MVDEREQYVGKITQKALLFGPDGNLLVTKVDDHWEPPGGRFEYGETLVGGLRRELREEVGVDAKIGPPVEAAYGGWLDGETGNPLVTLLYRCETEETGIDLNEEHDDYEWVTPDTAAERLKPVFSARMVRAVERAAALDDEEPFAAVTDPYADTEVSKEEILAELAAARAADPPETTDI